MQVFTYFQSACQLRNTRENGQSLIRRAEVTTAVRTADGSTGWASTWRRSTPTISCPTAASCAIAIETHKQLWTRASAARWAHKKGGVVLSAYHATQGRRIVQTSINTFCPAAGSCPVPHTRRLPRLSSPIVSDGWSGNSVQDNARRHDAFRSGEFFCPVAGCMTNERVDPVRVAGTNTRRRGLPRMLCKSLFIKAPKHEMFLFALYSGGMCFFRPNLRPADAAVWIRWGRATLRNCSRQFTFVRRAKGET